MKAHPDATPRGAGLALDTPEQACPRAVWDLDFLASSATGPQAGTGAAASEGSAVSAGPMVAAGGPSGRLSIVARNSVARSSLSGGKAGGKGLHGGHFAPSDHGISPTLLTTLCLGLVLMLYNGTEVRADSTVR